MLKGIISWPCDKFFAAVGKKHADQDGNKDKQLELHLFIVTAMNEKHLFQEFKGFVTKLHVLQVHASLC